MSNDLTTHHGPTAQEKVIAIPPDQHSNMLLTCGTPEYAAAVSGLTGEDLGNFLLLPYMHFRRPGQEETQVSRSYFDAARASTMYAIENIEEAVADPKKFRQFMEEFTGRSVYYDLKGKPIAKPEFRARTKRMELNIPPYLIDGFNRILEAQGQSPITIPEGAQPQQTDYGELYQVIYDASNTPIETVLENLRNRAHSALTLQKLGHRGTAQREAILFLKELQVSWLWGRNHGRSSNLFKALMQCMTHDDGFPHGITDLAAFCMNNDQFVAYVRYCLKIKLNFSEE